MKIIVPDIGDFKEIAVIEVLAAVGDIVAAEDSLITLESDKATMDVPSPVAGRVVAVHVAPGALVSCGTHIADIETDADSAADSPEKTNVKEPEEPQSSTPQKAEENVAETNNSTTTAAATAVKEVLTPDIGDFSGVAVIEILVKVGDVVAVEDSLLTLESDKATMDIPSPFAGTIQEIGIGVGDKISQGDFIARIATTESVESPPSSPTPPPKAAADVADSASPASSTTTDAKRAPPLPPVVQTTDNFGKAHASPSVRKFARELGANLQEIKGSGQRGRILKSDVQLHVKAAMQNQNTSQAGGALPVVPAVDFSKFGEIEIHPLSRIRKLSAANLSRNWLVAPHVTQFAEADITDMDEFRKSLAEETKKEGYRMTPLAFFIRAAVMALKQFPQFNSSLQADGENLAHKKYFNIGVAVDTPGGLVVPVVRDAARKGLTDIARELGELSTRARDGKLKAADMQGGCFTISSLGGIGGSFFTPIINLPEVAIMGVSRSQIRPEWNGKEFVPRLILPLSLSHDYQDRWRRGRRL
ncbi:MAG: dihydrolipoyllysine-residue acetyltransferase [Gammaproteobacteria bacterium WSBS_2016_MAG_OTU1]